MKKLQIKSSTRLSLTIGFVCASFIWLAAGMQIIPNPFQPVIDGRVNLTKSVAASVTTMAENQRLPDMQRSLDLIVNTNDDLLSMGVRRNGRYVAHAGPHELIWKGITDGESTESQISVSVMTNGKEWGELQLMFQPLPIHGWQGMMIFPLPMVAFIACAVSLATWYVLNKTLKYLNPSKVVPGRVRSAFDTLAEGLMLIDKSGEIAHANESFCKMLGQPIDEIVGINVNSLGWELSEPDMTKSPWAQCLARRESVCGEIVEIKTEGSVQKYIVNATPITGSGNENRGVLCSFDNVTDLEAKKAELADAVTTLRRSRDEIERQNEQLHFLANYDPMTKCMNRRAFWVQYETYWSTIEPSELSIMMLDVDHFKSINDTYGHSVGDEVLIGVGQLLKDLVGDRGAICRYGGEEFVVLCPNMSFDQAVGIAEEVGQEFRNRKLGGLDVTVSLGVSNRAFKAMDPQHMLDQADQCLYAAKRNGRDQVVRFDECPTDDEVTLPEDTPQKEPEAPIQYSSVTGLLSALSFRSQETAEHSIRVADLAVAMSTEVLTRRELYKLEVCALLHDIGKIGVPDAILNKPGPLSAEEWELMAKHDDIGVEIVRAAFASDEIARIIAGHHFCFAVRNSKPDQALPQDKVPLCARIITVCDAFDSMVSNHVYRKSMSIEEAFAELHRCTPDQFDPDVVQLLVRYVSKNGYHTNSEATFDGSTRSAVVIGKHIESLCEAIESEDVNQLKTVVDDLKNDAFENQATGIVDAAKRLDDAIGKNTDIPQILELADEVVGMCRSTRGAFVESAEKTFGKDQPTKHIPPAS